MWDEALDLLLGSSCVVCARAGRILCRPCRTELPRGGRTAWPTPSPPGLALPVASGAYDGALKLLVNAHKEQRAFALATPLGEVLAEAVRELLALVGRPAGRVLVVPVPSRAAVVRRRGHDPLLRTARHAAVRLRRTGVDVRAVRLLRATTAVRDQAGLGAGARASNLHGTMRSRPAPGRPPVVVVVDDVLTTGATAREAQRALEEAGWPVVGVATVAATHRRRPPPTSSGLRSLPLSMRGD